MIICSWSSMDLALKSESLLSTLSALSGSLAPTSTVGRAAAEPKAESMEAAFSWWSILQEALRMMNMDDSL